MRNRFFLESYLTFAGRLRKSIPHDQRISLNPLQNHAQIPRMTTNKKTLLSRVTEAVRSREIPVRKILGNYIRFAGMHSSLLSTMRVFSRERFHRCDPVSMGFYSNEVGIL